MSAAAATFCELGRGQRSFFDQPRRLFLDLPQSFEHSASPGPTEIKIDPLSILHGYMLP